MEIICNDFDIFYRIMGKHGSRDLQRIEMERVWMARNCPVYFRVVNIDIDFDEHYFAFFQMSRVWITVGTVYEHR